ncbi:inactive serine/threonine-protein kinase 19-like [Ylistrum balloti]|uniref:inactive serine/threonine-protein kinase 19-like n=1 Tax=Ylistrum balloti TaxID=509963 RepID=UPI002905A03C|nr:inactive serine/threonine-protein kinase 19-like [Ylistrum balloti]
MSRKRTQALPDIYKPKRRLCSATALASNGQTASINTTHGEIGDVILNDTHTFLNRLKGLFPADKFKYKLPPIVLKHQLYGMMNDRTKVDQELNDLRKHGLIKLFKLGSEADEYCILFTNDYEEHVKKTMVSLAISPILIERFSSNVVRKCQDVCVTKETLMMDYKFSDFEITQLLKASVITVKDIGNWWLSIPNAGTFMKCFLRGRKAVLTMIRKCKYKEILRKDLEHRKWPKICRLGLIYHVHDIIGGELVHCVQTTSGQLLRLKE